MKYFNLIALMFVGTSTFSNSLSTSQDIIIQGDSLHYDTKQDISTAIGQNSPAYVEWGETQKRRKLYAAIIKAKMKSKNDTQPKDEGNQEIEWIEAEGNVRFETQDKVMTAKKCHHDTKTNLIKCYENVIITSGPNRLNGDEGIFDLNNEHYEVKTTSSKRVEALIHPQTSNSKKVSQ